MALVASDFTRPTGRLDPAWFSNLSTDLAAWITEAEAKSSVEAAQRAWVYYRAYADLADAVMMRPAQQASEGDSVTRTAAQLAHWARQRDRALAQYRIAIGGSPQPVGGVTPTTPAW